MCASTASPSTAASPRVLRHYQLEAVQAVIDVWGSTAKGIRRNPVVILPTGSGKSTVIAKLACVARDMGMRVVMLAHRRELLDQMADNVAAVDPTGGPVGIVQAERDNPHTAIVAASLQTLVANPRRLRDLGHRDVVLVDEMHHSVAETYLDVLTALGVATGGTDEAPVFACGFTATASRADGGLGKLWDTVAYEKPLKWAIEQGFLVAPRGKTVVLPDLHLEQLTVRAGDYAAGELETAMTASTFTTVDAITHHAADRRMLVFAAGVDHAEALADSLTQAGIPARAVTGATDTPEREEIYSAFRTGEAQALVTVQVLTEGADFPMCDCVVMARPTRSQVLYSQMVGRALRLWEGKETALVLDLAGSTRDMSLVTLTDLHSEAPTKRVSPQSDEDPGQEEPVRRERVQREGRVRVEDFDLMQTSSAVWLTTYKGVRFLDAGGVVVMLWPPAPHLSPDAPATIGTKFYGRAGESGWYATYSTGAEAVEHAERLAAEIGELPRVTESWRRKSAPSEAQLRYAEMLGIPHAERKTRARLSDDITVAKVSKLIDPYL